MLIQSLSIQNIAEIIVTILVLICTYVIIPLVKSKLTAQQLSTIDSVALTVVHAAEQLTGTSNTDKKSWALSQAQTILGKLGIKVDATTLDNHVESNVKKLKLVAPDVSAAVSSVETLTKADTAAAATADAIAAASAISAAIADAQAKFKVAADAATAAAAMVSPAASTSTASTADTSTAPTVVTANV